jgi:uncharacterized protein YecE (DUF72 family)
VAIVYSMHQGRTSGVQDKWADDGRVFVGCSGWHYKDWRGIVYPEALPQRLWLPHYSTVFRTVEINATFYRMPSQSTVRSWKRSVGEGFLFAVKGSRVVTHVRRLSDASDSVQQFCDRIAELDDTRGPVLWQLPPTLSRDDAVLSRFLHVLPSGFRHAIEFRHPSWWHTDVYAALAANRIAICLVDMPGFMSPLVATSDFVYARFHGADSLYVGKYSDDALRVWAERLRGVAGNQAAIYAYFNNDARGYAVENALTFRRLLARP